MPKSNVLDKIQNPDVPGLEDTLPPPPPPPPPPIISANAEKEREREREREHATTPMPHHAANNVTYPHISPAAYYAAPPASTQQTWWLPNETDTDVYTQWYESAYKAALQAAQDKDSGKSKIKYYKRKAEPVDAKVDAEKVAIAQKELSALMKPLKCDLCNAVMNSTLQARLHYQGKPHQKKVSMFLNQSAKKLKTEDGQVSSTTGSDWNTYCEMCKIWFTSQTDASQHYGGKKHLKAAFGTTTKPKPRKNHLKNPIDPTGRFGIAMKLQPQPPAIITIEPTPTPIPPVPQYSQPAVPLPTPLRCDLCGISANRQDQLETHKRGAKHLKMLKLHGMSTTTNEATPVPTGPIDYSIYRTPSGQYYCAPCNLSLNSEITFGQHMESKKHKNQVNPKPQQTQQQPPSAPTSPVAKKPKKK